MSKTSLFHRNSLNGIFLHHPTRIFAGGKTLSLVGQRAFKESTSDVGTNSLFVRKLSFPPHHRRNQTVASNGCDSGRVLAQFPRPLFFRRRQSRAIISSARVKSPSTNCVGVTHRSWVTPRDVSLAWKCTATSQATFLPSSL